MRSKFSHENVMSVVEPMVNFVRAQGLNNREFRQLLESSDLEPEDISFCTISLKGIVQRKGPFALPSSGRNRTIWLSRVYASPNQPFTTGKFGVVVKVLDLHAPCGSDRGSSMAGPKIFLLGKKKVKKKLRHFSPFPFPHKKLPDCRQFVTSLTFKMESREIIIFVDSNQAIRPQHTMHPASLMRQLAIAQWLVRPAVNLYYITPFNLHQQLFFLR